MSLMAFLFASSTQRLLLVFLLWQFATLTWGGWEVFTRTGLFGEQSHELRTVDGVRIVINAPDETHFDIARPTTLILYALPNGNTIEQTMGCGCRAGLDWRYDIQHIAAQTRLLRRHVSGRNIIVAYLEANTLSWPNWRAARPDHPREMVKIIDAIVGRLPDDDVDIVLAAHSGGGAFVLGTIDAADTIPASISRIVFLDANYSFDAQRHGAKLLAWLAGDDTRQLIVVAYDDREIEFEGKKVVGPTGGTFRATARMQQRFAQDIELSESRVGEFNATSGLDGRLHLLVHPNPDNRILHTALVGEMNGFLHALTVGNPDADKVIPLATPRAYTKWIAPPADSRPIPPRPPDAETGSAFIDRVAHLTAKEREAAITREVLAGNIPVHLRELRLVRIVDRAADGRRHTLEYEVMPDYLAIGSDDDFVRMPMTPKSAQQIANVLGFTLPTPRMVDQIHDAAEVVLDPLPLTERREDPKTFAGHHRLIQVQIETTGVGALVSGIKKDVVLTSRLAGRKNRVALYGWHRRSGKPIQPLTTVHVDTYVDYSHGIRLVRRRMWLDGEPIDFEGVATDPNLHALISDEGVLHVLCY